MKQIANNALGRFAKALSGYGLRRKYPAINKLYLQIKSKLAPRKVLVNGYTLYLDPADSLELASRGIYEPHETNLIRNVVKPGDVVLDIGANIGYFTILMSQLVGEAGKVIAFEPEKTNFDLLEKNVAANHCGNVVCFPYAVSDENGEIKIYLDDFGAVDHHLYADATHARSQVIKAVKLDDLLAREARVDFIKMDIQGSEAKAVKGMEELLAKNANIKVLAEFWPVGLELAGSSGAELLNIFERLGFTLYDINSLEPPQHPSAAKDLIEKYPVDYRIHANILCVRQP